MKKEDARSLLKQVIQNKEKEQVAAGILLKAELNALYESIKPLNILKNTLKGLITNPAIQASVLDTALGAATGYLSKKVIVRTSHNPLVKIVGSVFQFGISTLVMKNSGAIKLVGGYILKSIFQARDTVTEKIT